MVSRRSWIPCAVSLVLIQFLCGCAPKAAKLFPDFAHQKATLGAVALVADVVVVEDVIGSTEKVYLDDCKELGEVVIATFESALRDKGFAVEKKPLVSVGQVVDPSAEYRILSTWSQHKMDSKQFPILAPPFYVDSTLCHDDGARAAWKSVMHQAWAYAKRDEKPGPPIPEAIELQDELGTHTMFLVQVVGTKIPFGKTLGQSILESMGNTGVPVGNTRFRFAHHVVDITQFSGTALKVTMIDCRNGEVLWSDSDYKEKHIKRGRVASMASDLMEHLP